MEVVNSASQYIIEYGDTSGGNESDSALFQQLIALIFTQFRSIIRSHTLILKHLEKSLASIQQPRPNVKIHNEEYLWTKVQSVVSADLMEAELHNLICVLINENEIYVI